MHATAQQLEIALAQLSEADHLRLRNAARRRLGGTPFRDEHELVAEAVATAYLAARGQGGRRWTTDVAFMAYLCNTIRGIASDARRSGVTHPTLTGLFGPEDPLPHDDLAAGSVEDEWCELEEQQLRAAQAAACLAGLREDEEVQWVIRGIREELSARQVVARSGMTRTQYDTARRRLRRALGGG